jgi:transcriptional regulator with XRE-family HTH domain
MLPAKQTSRITKLREERGLTLEQLAESVGISTSYLWRLENEKRNLSLKNVAKIANALGVPPEQLVAETAAQRIPILTWVSAGTMARDDGQQDIIGETDAADLDPKGRWIALRVEGDSMDRISPPGSLIFVNVKDRRLVPNACYIITNGDGEATYKRFRANPPRFEPVSTNPAHEPIFPDGEPTVLGRVRRSVLEM